MNTGNLKKILVLAALIPVLTPCADVQAGLKINLKPKSSHEEKQTKADPDEATKGLISAARRHITYPTDPDHILVFIGQGANVNAVCDNQGHSVLFCIKQREHDENTRREHNENTEKLIAILLDAGATENDVDLADRRKSSEKPTKQLIRTLRIGDLRDQARIERLIKEGADVNAVDNDGSSILSLAEKRGEEGEKVVAILVAAGAKKDGDEQKQDNADISKDGESVAEGQKVMDENTRQLFRVLRYGSLNENSIQEEIKRLIKRGTNVNATDENGNTPLFTAETRKRDNEKVVAMLVAAGAKKNDADSAKAREIEEIQNREKVARATESLFKAVRLEPELYGADVIIRRIDSATEAGADVNGTNENGNSVLFVAEQRRQHKEVLDALLYAGAKKNDADAAKEREIAKEATEELIRTCKNFHLDTKNLNALLAKGADVNGTNENGNSVLFLAECQGIFSGDKDRSKELIEALIAAGAKKNEADIIKGKEIAEKATPRLVAKCKGDYKYRGDEESDRKEFEQLIALGADVNATDENGNSVLFICEKKNLRNFEKLLVNAGAKKNKVDATSDLLELCKGHLEKNPSDNLSREEVLKAAAQRVQTLIDSGASVNAHDEDGNSALFLAELNEKTEIIPLLTQAGAKMNPGEPEKLKEEATKKLFWLAGKWEVKNAKEKAELYISRGADVNAKDENGHSLLFNALLVRSVQGGVGATGATMMKDYLGAMGMGQHGEEGAAVVRAMVGDNQEGLFSSPLCVALINAGAEASKDELTTIYFISLKTGNWSAIKEFRDRNFDLRAEGEGGKNAFHVLSENQHVSPNESVVDALVKAGVNMEKKAEFDDAFLTPLGYAIKNKHVEAVRVLLEHGANRKATVDIKDVMGNRSISLTDFANDMYNKAKRAQDLALTRGITRNNMQLIAVLDAAVQDYQKIISMLEQ